MASVVNLYTIAASLLCFHGGVESVTISNDEWVTIGMDATTTCTPDVIGFTAVQWLRSSNNVTDFIKADDILYYDPITGLITYQPGIDGDHYDAQQSSDGSSYSLIVKSVTLNDTAKYWCRFYRFPPFVPEPIGSSNTHIRVPLSTVAITYDGISYSNTGDSFWAVAGNGRHFTCTTPGINPAAVFSWNLVLGSSTSQPQGSQTNSSNTDDNRLTDSTSTITVDIPEGQATGQLTCGATNRQDGQTGAEIDIALNLLVEVLPKVSSMSLSGFIGNTPGSVDQGSQQMIQCMVPGTRPAATIEWYLGGVNQTSGTSTTSQAGQNNLIDTTGTWTFTPRRSNHDEEVRCEASTPESQAPSVVMVTLNVNGPPDPPVITGVTSPIMEDVEINLTCEADMGYPNDWRLDWANGGSGITGPSTSWQSSGSRYRFSSLLDFTPQREDNGNNITCTATKTAWTPGPVASTGPIDVRFCARFVTFTGCLSTIAAGNMVCCPSAVTAGNIVSFTCTSGSSNPATTLTMFQGSDDVIGPTDDESIPGDHGGRVTSITYSTGVLNKTNNGDMYSCCATNAAIPSCTTPLCQTCTLNVEYAPEFTSLTQLPDSPVTEGSNVVLACTVDANPRPSDITWKKQDSSEAFSSVYNDVTSTLILSNIRREHAGYYMCRANNGVPTDDPNDDVVSDLITVIVHYEVNITNKAMNEVGVSDGDTAVLTCIAVGNPQPAMEWYSPNNTIIISDTDEGKFLITNNTSGGDRVFGFEVTSKLTIKAVDSRVDYGVYTCITSNGIGREDSLNITLTGTRRPDKPTRVEITERTAASLTVTWKPGYDGGEEQSFRVSYRKTSDSSTEVFTEDTDGKTTSTATGLDDYTEYEIRVYAKNAIGESIGYGNTMGYTLPKAPGPDSGITVEFNKDEDTVKVAGLKGNGCIQLEVQYQGNDAWQQCGACITADQTITLSEWCAPSQKRRRRAVGDIEAVRAKKCFGDLCSEPAPVEIVLSQLSKPDDSTGVIVGVIVGFVVLIVIVLLGVFAKRKYGNHNNGDRETLRETVKIVRPKAKHPQADTHSPYQEITELEVLGNPANQEPGTAAYGNVQTTHKAFPRDQLKIIKELGHGAFGQVLLAEASGMTQGSKVTLVAVKTLKEEANKSDKADMMRELDLMKKLPDHCNVVRLLGFCVEKDPPYIIVEYLSRGNLKDLLKDSRSKGGRVYGNLHGISKSLTSKDLMKFAKDAADGMTFISSQQCIHRDLAARNVLVAEDMTCKVSDFGLARDVMNIRVYERGSEGALPMRWMALESILDDVYTTESDVWSYGVLLWEIVTLGARPYPAMTAKIMVNELQSGYRMPKPQHCQEELYEMMLRCWDADPESRPTFKMISKELSKLINKGKEYISIKDFQETVYEVVLTEDAGEKF